MARILIFCIFCVSAANIQMARAYSSATSFPYEITTEPFTTPGSTWQRRNLGGWMFSVMPYAVVRFRSAYLSDVRGITLCLRAVTEKKWMIGKEIQLLIGENTAIYIDGDYNLKYTLQVAYNYQTFDLTSMEPIQEVPSIWKNYCLTWNSSSGMAQLWLDGRMSIRKGLSRGTVFSGQAELTLLQFEGQVSDVYMWDSVLSVRELQRYLYQHSVPSRQSVLDWRQIEFRADGYVVKEPAYPKRFPAGPAKHKKRKCSKGLKKCRRQEI